MIGCVQSRLSTSSPRLCPGSVGPQIDDPAELLLDAGDVVVEDVVVEQVALLRSAARIADHAGRSPGQRDRPVAGVLEAAQRDQPDQVADVEAVGGRVASVVDRHRAVGHLGPQELAIGRVVDEVAGLEIGDQVHTTVEGTLAAWTTRGTIPSSLADSGSRARPPRTRAPLYRALSDGIADDPDLVRLLRHAPAEQQLPVLLFASTHYLLLDEPDSELAQWYPNLTADHRSPDDPALMPAFKRFVDDHEHGADRPARHAEDPDQRGRPLRLLPAGARAARRRGGPARASRRRRERRAQPPARPVRVPLRRQAGRDGEAETVRVVGGPSDVVLDVTTRGARARSRPGCRRSAPDSGSTAIRSTSPIPTAARWLEACVWPDQADRFHRLRAAIALATAVAADDAARRCGRIVGRRDRRRRRRRPSGGDELVGAQLPDAAANGSTTSPSSTASGPSATCRGCSPSRRSSCPSCRSSRATLETGRDGVDDRPLAERDPDGRDRRHLPSPRLLDQLALTANPESPRGLDRLGEADPWTDQRIARRARAVVDDDTGLDGSVRSRP